MIEKVNLFLWLFNSKIENHIWIYEKFIRVFKDSTYKYKELRINTSFYEYIIHFYNIQKKISINYDRKS